MSTPTPEAGDPVATPPELVFVSGANSQFNQLLLSDIDSSVDSPSPQRAVNIQFVKNAIAQLVGTSGSTYDTLTQISEYLTTAPDVGPALLTQLGTLTTNVSTAQSAADNAQTAANNAQTAANNAQTAANTADGKAVAAQTAANTADGKAVAAQTAADTAQSAADNAQSAANNKVDTTASSTGTQSIASGIIISGQAGLDVSAKSKAGSLEVVGLSELKGSVDVTGQLDLSAGSLLAQQFQSMPVGSGDDNGGFKLKNTETAISYLYFGEKWRVAASLDGSKLSFQYYYDGDKGPFAVVGSTTQHWEDAVPFSIV